MTAQPSARTAAGPMRRGAHRAGIRSRLNAKPLDRGTKVSNPQRINRRDSPRPRYYGFHHHRSSVAFPLSTAGRKFRGSKARPTRLPDSPPRPHSRWGSRARGALKTSWRERGFPSPSRKLRKPRIADLIDGFRSRRHFRDPIKVVPVPSSSLTNSGPEIAGSFTPGTLTHTPCRKARKTAGCLLRITSSEPRHSWCSGTETPRGDLPRDALDLQAIAAGYLLGHKDLTNGGESPPFRWRWASYSSSVHPEPDRWCETASTEGMSVSGARSQPDVPSYPRANTGLAPGADTHRFSGGAFFSGLSR